MAVELSVFRWHTIWPKLTTGKLNFWKKKLSPAAGATAKAAGGIRAQFVTKENIEMSMLSEELFKSFKEDTGYDALFDQVGYLFLIKDDKDAEVFKESFELQKSLGLNIEILSPDEIAKVAPHVALDGVQFGTFCPDDGLGDPHEFLSGYDHAARKLGVEIEYDAEVTGFEKSGGKIKTVSDQTG